MLGSTSLDFSNDLESFSDFLVRHINLANATLDELEQLAQACETASFGVDKKDVLDETYRKAGKMDSDQFSPIRDPAQTDLIRIIRSYLLEGTKSTKIVKAELYKLNMYGEHIPFQSRQ